ncbi:helix-turn-helix domain-containing protein [Richelia sinica]|uniref:helix-turn-helix domain-containing protein n=1 Tax=Richelia sinica TaxID=1357545 RepID=UPI001F5579D6
MFGCVRVVWNDALAFCKQSVSVAGERTRSTKNGQGVTVRLLSPVATLRERQRVTVNCQESLRFYLGEYVNNHIC